MFEIEAIHEREVLLNEALPVGLAEHAQCPAQDTEAAHDADEYQPEPDEQVDHLVEEVDGEYALDGITLHVPHAPHVEVTHGDTREPGRILPFASVHETLDDIDSIKVVVSTQKGIHQEDLAQHVHNVHQLKIREIKPTEQNRILCLSVDNRNAHVSSKHNSVRASQTSPCFATDTVQGEVVLSLR